MDSRDSDGQSEEVSRPRSEAGSEDSPIDEILVVSDKSPKQLRREIRLIESKIYSIYNDRNDDDRYDIICRRRVPVGSQIPRTTCKARLYWDAVSEATEDWEAIANLRNIVPDRSDHTARLREGMLLLASRNPALLSALVERRRLVTQLERAKSEQSVD